MKTVIANYKNLERHGLFVKFVRIFSKKTGIAPFFK